MSETEDKKEEPFVPLWLRNKKANEDKSALYALKQSKEQAAASGQPIPTSENQASSAAKVIADSESDSRKLGHTLPTAEVRKRMKDFINPDSD